MKKILVLLLVLIPVLLLVFANIVYSAPPVELGAPPPGPSFPMSIIDAVVDIPDPALRAALHDKTGVPVSDPIWRSDLKALTGFLELSGLGIADAEGLQYCANVDNISLDNNDLADLPDFSGMNGLKVLNMDNNNFTTVPSELFDTPDLRKLTMCGCPITDIDLYIADMTSLRELDLSDTDLHTFPPALLSMNNLEILYLDNTPVSAIPDNINHMTHLEELYVDNTGLESLPEALFDMTGLKLLYASLNEIESIPSSISRLTNLQRLALSHNKLESLPDSICSLPNLMELFVTYNNLYSLPADIGDHIHILVVRCNRLTAIPQSVISSPSVTYLDISLNRFASLPSGLAEKTFSFISLEFNFLDVSPGSPAREMLDANTSETKHYLNQLTPVAGLTATPSSDSVTLSWSPCPDGSDGDVTWTVEGYVVYQYDGGMVKIADADKSQTSYVHTGLAPETAYSYRVGVDYHVINPGNTIDYINRGYTKADATTLAYDTAETASPVPSAVSTESAGPASVSPEVSPSTLPAAEVADTTSEGVSTGFPVWLIIIAAVGALGIVGTGTALVILKFRKPKS